MCKCRPRTLCPTMLSLTLSWHCWGEGWAWWWPDGGHPRRNLTCHGIAQFELSWQCSVYLSRGNAQFNSIVALLRRRLSWVMTDGGYPRRNLTSFMALLSLNSHGNAQFNSHVCLAGEGWAGGWPDGGHPGRNLRPQGKQRRNSCALTK